ncbi:hypothetical protein Tco_0593653 [Tanacetum coccineum]
MKIATRPEREDREYAVAVKIQKFFIETRKIVRQLTRRRKIIPKEEYKCGYGKSEKKMVYMSVIQNHPIGECSKPLKNNDQRAFIGGAWSNNGEDEMKKTKDETCLVAQTLDEICLGINLEPDEWIKDSGCSKHMTDSDHAGDYVDRKSTSGVCTFMGCCLTSWFSKKQTALAISTTESEYVSAKKACQQALWIKQTLIDYGVRLDDIPIMCDNKGAIDLSKNLVSHSEQNTNREIAITSFAIMFKKEISL